jgi:hypothetical protein
MIRLQRDINTQGVDMKRITPTQIITVLVTFGVILINALANILPINGLNTGEISDQFEIYFVPAGYVFSIWGLIYLGLIAYAVYQVLPSQSENPVLNKIAPYYWIGTLGNVFWLFLWHYEVFGWTILFMGLILVNLLFIYRNLAESEGLIKWLVQLPFSIYLGWISVATIANASQWLYYLEWNNWGIAPELWAVILLGVATLLGVLMSLRENDTAYGLVLIWAFLGITVSQAGTASVVVTAFTGAGLIGLSLILGYIKYKKIY